MTEEVSIRPIKGPVRFRRNAKMIIRDGQLIIIDRLAREHRFPLRMNGRLWASFCVASIGNTATAISDAYTKWIVLDGEAKEVLETSPEYWEPHAFVQLAHAAGATLKKTGEPDAKVTRHTVDLRPRRDTWFTYRRAVPLTLVCVFALANLLEGRYLIWVLAGLLLAVTKISRLSWEAVVVSRNRRNLPAEESLRSGLVSEWLEGARDERLWLWLAVLVVVTGLPLLLR